MPARRPPRPDDGANETDDDGTITVGDGIETTPADEPADATEEEPAETTIVEDEVTEPADDGQVTEPADDGEVTEPADEETAAPAEEDGMDTATAVEDERGGTEGTNTMPGNVTTIPEADR